MTDESAKHDFETSPSSNQHCFIAGLRFRWHFYQQKDSDAAAELLNLHRSQ